MATEQRIPTWTSADRLEKARKDAGLSGSELAECIGVSRSTIVNYESPNYSKKRRPIVLKAWAQEFTGVSPPTPQLTMHACDAAQACMGIGGNRRVDDPVPNGCRGIADGVNCARGCIAATANPMTPATT